MANKPVYSSPTYWQHDYNQQQAKTQKEVEKQAKEQQKPIPVRNRWIVKVDGQVFGLMVKVNK